ncbi:DNA mismatch repair protein MutS [Bdellovibrio sp. HCB337]|uniref:DNA mismatch repair protein MutS n=1 Tax=Bdellovibrio sp. HCB337 TaxID=3394358 RepID=UPI0039A516C1
MKQYWDIKSLHQDKVLLFRMGDFFEMFYDDATKAAPILGIALTQRNKKSQDETPMCGMPHHSVSGPINKLLAHGFKVAICDQVEDPKTAKGIVKRAVTRILTPGMVYDSDTLDGTMAHYLVSFDKDSMSFLDSTTGESFFFKTKDFAAFKRFLEVLPVAEIVLAGEEKAFFVEEQKKNTGLQKILVSQHEDIIDPLHPLLAKQAPMSAARLLSYVKSMGGDESLKTLSVFEERDFQQRLELTPTTLRHLEVFATYKGEGLGSLFFAVNRTNTSAGSRLLRQWLSFPLVDQKAIEARFDNVDIWKNHLTELKRVRQILGQMGDIERRLGKISQPQCNGRDLLALAQSIRAGLSSLEVALLLRPLQNVKAAALEKLHKLAHKIENTLVEDPPLTTKQGYLIRNGVSSELDELIELSTQSQNLLAKMEAEEREKTGISSLKIRYNNVFGYYIEITNTHKDKVPKYYQRKQTLANAERYCTDALIELERKVLTAQTKRGDLEFEYFETLRREVLTTGSELMILAHECSELDVVASFAWLSLEEKYVRPQFSVQRDLVLKSSRHPVVEQTVKKNFVPNDIELRSGACLLLTGPNMAGKSTIMRQVALTVILAQAGCFVPADFAEMPVFDAIFTRIGASDQLSEGLSTFMVEMTETAAMLKNATHKSLVILDEVGRGTSTFDGMCLAQSILEHLLSDVKTTTFFATHYHELTQLETSYPQIKNAHMTVADSGGEIRFLHTLVRGPAKKSYGIQVAELAGLPAVVVRRAKSLLKSIESQKVEASSQLSLLDIPFDEPTTTPDPRLDEIAKFMQEVKKYPLTSITPIEALNQIAMWQKSIETLQQDMN